MFIVALIQVTLTFTTQWNDALTDTSSPAYKEAVVRAEGALKTMTGWQSSHFSGVVWTFSQGSVIAIAEVPIAENESPTDVLSKLENFDTTTIPDLASVRAQEVTGKMIWHI